MGRASGGGILANASGPRRKDEQTSSRVRCMLEATHLRKLLQSCNSPEIEANVALQKCAKACKRVLVDFASVAVEQRG